MMSFYRTILYVLIILLSIVYRLTNAETETIAVTLAVSTNSNEPINITSIPTVSTTTTSSNSSTIASSTNSTMNNLTTSTTNNNNLTISTTSTSTITTMPQTRTSTATNVRPDDTSTGPGWWLLIALLITIVIVIIAGVIFYYRQQSPYRRSTNFFQWCRQCQYRFLRNWRSHDDDADNIILQLEQTEVTNNQWPPRISFT